METAGPEIIFQDTFKLKNPYIIDYLKLPYAEPSGMDIPKIAQGVIMEQLFQLNLGTTERKLSKVEYGIVLQYLDALILEDINVPNTIATFKTDPLYLREDDDYYYFSNINENLSTYNLANPILDLNTVQANEKLFRPSDIVSNTYKIDINKDSVLVCPELKINYAI